MSKATGVELSSAAIPKANSFVLGHSLSLVRSAEDEGPCVGGTVGIVSGAAVIGETLGSPLCGGSEDSTGLDELEDGV